MHLPAEAHARHVLRHLPVMSASIRSVLGLVPEESDRRALKDAHERVGGSATGREGNTKVAHVSEDGVGEDPQVQAEEGNPVQRDDNLVQHLGNEEPLYAA